MSDLERDFRKRLAASLVFSWALAVATPLTVSAATYVVDSTADAIDANTGDGICDDGFGNCTLRAAFMEARETAVQDTIVIPAGTFTMTISGRDDTAAKGDYDITEDTVVIGAGAGVTIIDANDVDRAIEIRVGSTATIMDLTVRNGNLRAHGAGIHIQNGTGNISNVIVESCVGNEGAGIYANGPLNLTDSIVRNNDSDTNGNDGGGIYLNRNPGVLERVAIYGNIAVQGGGIHVKGGNATLDATNVTISGNTATSEGGGLWFDRETTLTNVTITNNTAPAGRGAGIHRNARAITLENTIVANNVTGLDCLGVSADVVSLGANLDSDGSCGLGASDTSNVDPLLGALADNGGNTFTHALLSGSVAIDNGNAGNCPTEDQRGFARPSGAACDIGAFELSTNSASGTVYEDIDGDADLVDAETVSNALVLCWLDGGDAAASGTDDTFVDSTRTDGLGEYTIAGLGNGTYWITVDSKTITPSVVFNAGSGPDTVWAEQTYATSGGFFADGAGGTAQRASSGPCYGGRREGISDVASALGTSEHVTEVTLASGNETGIDFGFSFNVVTETRDGDDDGSAERSIQGSMRQFLQNANSMSGANTMRFVPVLATNASGGGGSWWQVGVSGSALPQITDAFTTIDGTAYCAWDDGTATCSAATQTRDTNSGSSDNTFFGSDAVGTGADGIDGSGDEPTLPTYSKPEFEIDGNDLGTVLDLAASSGTVQDIAVFDAPSATSAVLFSAGTGGLVTASYLGARADGTDPGAGSRVTNAVRLSGGAADITNNLIAYTEDTSLLVQEASLVQGNDIFAMSATAGAGDDGISVESTSGESVTIRRNRIDQARGFGIESVNAAGPFTIDENLVSRSGQGGDVEDGGIRLFGASSTVAHNVVTGSAGAGIVLGQNASPGSNVQNVLTENAIYSNGGLGIDLDVTNTGGADNPAGDGVTANDGSTDGTLPNLEMDYPVITATARGGTTLTVEGYVGTSATKVAGTHTIEVFKAASDGADTGEIEVGDAQSVSHGEGRWFIDSCTTAADGTFSCTLTVPGAVTLAVGDSICATARDAGGNTSEFGALVGTSGLSIVKRAYRLDGTAIADASNVPAGARVKFLIYVSNPGALVSDVSIRDILEAGFSYVAGSMNYDVSVASCAGLTCTGAEEDAIFAAADGGTAGTDAVDGDPVSISGTTIDIGDENAANSTLDIASDKVWAVVFTVKMN